MHRVIDRIAGFALWQDDEIHVVGRLFRALLVALVNGLELHHLVSVEDGPHDRRQHLLDVGAHVACDHLRTASIGRRVFHGALIVFNRPQPILRQVVSVLFGLLDHIRNDGKLIHFVAFLRDLNRHKCHVSR